MNAAKLVLFYFWLTLVAVFVPAQNSFAATYYVDASAANDTGNGSSGSPKKYIGSGLALLSSSGGDILIVRNGTYAATNDRMTGIPNGIPSAYNVVRAENDGGAVITAADSFDVASSYVQIEGFKFSGAYNKTVSGNHIKIKRCAFVSGPSGGNNVTLDFEGSYNLIEDCWIYGAGGRYKILMWRADHLILRRVVIRDDGGWTSDNSDPEAGVVVYETSNVELQNVIVIDSNLATYDNNNVGAFYVTGHAGNPPSNNVNFTGCIALNNRRAGWHNDTDDGGVGCTVTDTVIYGTESEGMGTSNTSMNITGTRITMGNVGDRFIGNWGNRSIAISNSVFWSSANASSGTVSVTFSDAYGQNDFFGSGVIHVNPLTNGLLYLPRIESASPLKTAGSGSTQAGAQILNKMGADGTLHGENGYNTLTANALWPWPNEARIKADFASVSGGARGFAAGTSLDGSAQTLTKYIWEYLGNTILCEIYGTCGSVTAPAAPSGLTVN
jgi:hypothetical protein